MWLGKMEKAALVLEAEGLNAKQGSLKSMKWDMESGSGRYLCSSRSRTLAPGGVGPRGKSMGKAWVWKTVGGTNGEGKIRDRRGLEGTSGQF